MVYLLNLPLPTVNISAIFLKGVYVICKIHDLNRLSEWNIVKTNVLQSRVWTQKEIALSVSIHILVTMKSFVKSVRPHLIPTSVKEVFIDFRYELSARYRTPPSQYLLC